MSPQPADDDVLELVDGPNPDLAQLAKLLGDVNWGRLAAKALGRAGASALPFLVTSVQSESLTERENAVYGLWWLATLFPNLDAPQAVVAVLSLINSQSGVKLEAFGTLRAFGPRVAPLADIIVSFLDNDDIEIIQGGCCVMEMIGPNATKNAPAKLISVAQKYAGHGSLVAHEAVKALASVPVQSETQVAVLIELLKLPNNLLRRDAVNAIEAAGSIAKSAIPALRGLCNDADADLRSASANALSKLTN